MKCAMFVLPLVLIVLAGCVDHERRTIGPLPPPIFATRTTPPPPVIPPQRVPEPVAPPTSRSLVGRTIVVDAGHGGRDPGARGVASTSEKNINLAIALQLGRNLEARGARVVYSRTTDRNPGLDDRAALAERVRADMLVSVHSDSNPKASNSGATVLIGRKASATSQKIGQQVCAALRSNGIECRGVRRQPLAVLDLHSRPGVLVECGFLTNRSDARRLVTESYQSQIAEAIADGIANYFGR